MCAFLFSYYQLSLHIYLVGNKNCGMNLQVEVIIFKFLIYSYSMNLHNYIVVTPIDDFRLYLYWRAFSNPAQRLHIGPL